MITTLDKDSIRDRAYALWEADGRPDGRDAEHWARAERELTDEAALADEQSDFALQPPLTGLPIH